MFGLILRRQDPKILATTSSVTFHRLSDFIKPLYLLISPETDMKHLSKGSEDVPLKENTLRLYSMRFCPYAQRVHLVLYAKQIPHDIVYIDLKDKPEWYLSRVASGKVPAIAVEGKDIYESLIIADYLEEKYPERPLYKPNNPLQKALDRILIDRFSRVTSVLYKLYLAPTLDINLLDTIFGELDYFEKELKNRGTTFFFGDKPGMVDYMIWPWSERLDMVRVIGGDKFKIPKERFPCLMQWIKCMIEDEAVKKHYLTPEQHAKYMTARKAGISNYDNILD